MVIPRYLPAPITGPIRHVSRLSRGLAARGHDVHILTTDRDVQGNPPETEVEDGVHIHRLPGFGLGHLTFARGVGSTLDELNPDIVHSQGYRNWFSLIAARWSSRAGRPFVLTPRGSLRAFEHMSTRVHQKLPNRLYDFVTGKRELDDAHVIVTSRQEREDAHQMGIDEDRVHIIPHGVDFDEFPDPDGGNHGDGVQFLFVGRLTVQRDIPLLLKAIDRARKEDPNIHLSIVGDFIQGRIGIAEFLYKRRVKRLYDALDLEDHVTFHGGVYGDDLWDYYRSSDVFVYPSTWDNFGHALVEAAYFGLPLISTPTGIAPDLVDGDEGGIIVDHDDVDAMADAILEVTDDAEQVRRWRDTVQRRARKFTIDQNIEDHVDLYENMISDEC